MPYAVAKDNVRLHYEEAGSGTPIIFLHEFAADHTNWEPQMRYFSRGHRCIAYSARGYTPSDVPPTPPSTPTSISIPTRSPCSIISASPKRISSACRWAPIRRCRSASMRRSARCR